MPRLRVPAIVAILAVWTLAPLVGTAPAEADSVSGTYVTRVSALDPALPGVTATAPQNGESITVQNPTDTPLYILGYNRSKTWPQGEPYLKITKDGVFQNKYSPAVYLNTQATIGAVPASANPNAQPDWQPVPGVRGDIYQWHDHRIHWMGSEPPPQVSADPHQSYLISTWHIPYVYGDLSSASAQRGSVTGTLTFEPGSRWSSYLTWIVIAIAVVATIGVQLWLRRRPRKAASSAEPGDPAGD